MKPEECTHLIYHANCSDGFGAAWSAWRLLKDKCKYIPALYNSQPPDLSSTAKVVIADFSYKRDVLLELKSKVADLLVLDHHKTAQEDLANLDFVEFDMTHSGAWLAWTFFQNELDFNLLDFYKTHPADFIFYIEDADLWTWELPKSREVSAALRGYPFDFETWNWLSQNLDVLKTEGEIVLKHKNQLVQKLCEQVQWRVIDGHKVPVVNTSIYFSDVCEALCKKFPDASFAAYYFDRSDGKRQWGLSSQTDFDVSAVAKKYMGGGHLRASGFEQKIVHLDEF